MAKGMGKSLVLGALEQARALGVKKVFTLTLEGGFFKKLGFKEVPKEHSLHPANLHRARRRQAPLQTAMKTARALKGRGVNHDICRKNYWADAGTRSSVG